MSATITKSKKVKKKQIVKPIQKSFWQSTELLIPLGIVLLITAALFYPSLNNGFVNWDDNKNIYENPNLEVFNWESIKGIFTDPIIGGYNPLSIFTFAVEKKLAGGFSTFLTHFNNLLLHLICVFFVFRILLLMKLSKEAAFVGALLFGIHPMRVESVAWATERKDVLFGAFYLAAMFTYIKYLTKKQSKFLIYTLVLFVFSLFSKIQAVSLPLSMLALDYYFKRPLKVKLVIEKWAFFGTSLIYGLTMIYILKEAGTLTDDVTSFGFIDRVFVGTYSFGVYLVKFILPYEMVPLYPYPSELNPMFYASPLVMIGFAAGLFWAFKKEHRALVFSGLFFFVNIMFLLQILGAGQGFKADRFTYIAYFGFIFIAAYFFQKLWEQKPKQRTIVGGAVAIYFLAFAYLTPKQIKIWENGETLWTHVIDNYSSIGLPFGNRGHHRRGEGQFNLALADYAKAVSFKPNASFHNSYGKTYFDMGDDTNAIAQYKIGIGIADEKIRNGFAIKDNEKALVELNSNLASAYGKSGQNDLALATINKALELDPNDQGSLLTRSLIYLKTGQYALAIPDQTLYLQQKPMDHNSWYERAICYKETGNIQAALYDFNQAIQINPQPHYLIERGKTYLNSNNKAQAAQDFQQAQQLGGKVSPELLQQAR